MSSLPRKRSLSLLLVGIMLASAFTGVTFLPTVSAQDITPNVDVTDLVVDTNSHGAGQTAILDASGDQVRVDYTISYDGADTLSCEFSWNSTSITNNVPCDSTAPNSFTWTPASNQDPGTDRVTITASEDGVAGGEGSGNSDADLLVDFDDPVPSRADVTIDGLPESDLTAAQPPILDGSGGASWDVKLFNPDDHLDTIHLFSWDDCRPGLSPGDANKTASNIGGDKGVSLGTFHTLNPGDFLSTGEENHAQDAFVWFDFTDEASHSATWPGEIRSPGSGDDCFQFIIDNKAPELATTNDLGLPAPASGVAIATQVDIREGTEFSLTEPNLESLGAGGLEISWEDITTKNDPTGASPVSFSEPLVGQFSTKFPPTSAPPSALPAGDYDVTVSAKDNTGHTSSVTHQVRWDPDPPELIEVKFTSHNSGCESGQDVFTFDGTSANPFELRAGESFCPGPYTVDVTIEETFPDGLSGGSIVDPEISEPSGQDETNFDTKSPTSSSVSGNQYTWTYTDITSGDSPFEFLVNLEEDQLIDGEPSERDLNASGSRIADTVLGFGIQGQPIVHFDPLDTDGDLRYDSNPSFELLDVTNGSSAKDCDPGNWTGRSVAQDGWICLAGSGTTSIQLAAASGSASGLPSTFTKSGDVWTTSWSAPDRVIQDLEVVAQVGGLSGASSAVSVTVEKVAPTIDGLTLYEWDGKDLRWESASTDREFPLEGLLLAKVEWDAFSTDQIGFRFYTDTDPVGDDQTDQFIEYLFEVNTEGDGAKLTGESARVHLADGQVPFDGTIPSDGCSGGGKDMQGLDRTCYFLIETYSSPTDANGITALSAGTDYTVGLRMTNAEGEARSELGNQWTAEGPDPSQVPTPSLDPGTPEVGVDNEVRIDLGTTDSDDLAEIGTWACMLIPLDVDSANPEEDPAYEVYLGEDDTDTFNCEPRELPILDTSRVTGRSFESLDDSDGDPTGERRILFKPSQLDLDTTGTFVNQDEFIENFYLRLILTDEFGNLLVKDFDQDGPGVATIADYRVGSNATTIVAPGQSNPAKAEYDSCFASTPSKTDCDSLAQRFKAPNTGCFQASQADSTKSGYPVPEDRTSSMLPRDDDSTNDNDRRDNTASNPCFRVLDLVPSGGSYPSIDIPLLLENAGNVPDDIQVLQSHHSGKRGWGVQLFEEGNAPADSSSIDRISVTVDERLQPTQPRSETVIARFHPSPSTLGGQSKVINVSAWSGGSSELLKQGSNLYLEARIIPVEQANVLVNGSETESFDAQPDDVFTVPMTIENRGNTRIQGTLALTDEANSQTTESCRLEGQPTSDSERNITLIPRTGGNRLSTIDLRPTDDALQVDVEVRVGENVEATDDGFRHTCQFQVLQDGSPVALEGTARPRLHIDAFGAPQIRFLETRGEDENEFDITGEEITRVVPPSVPSQTITFFIENSGTVSLSPRLSIKEVTNTLDLAAQWHAGEDESDPVIPLQEAQGGFDLDVSDTDDSAVLRTFDSAWTQGSQAGFHDCRSLDGDTPTDGQSREVCRITLTLDHRASDGSLKGVTGDELLYRLTFKDTSQAGGSAALDIRIVFDDVGEVAVDSVTNRVFDGGDVPTITFDATLFEDRRFDPAESRPQATLHIEASAAGFSKDCGEIPSSNVPGQEAVFEVDLSYSDGPEACTPSTLTWPSSEVPETFEITLKVQDENGSLLRQVHPAMIHLTSGTASSLQPASQIEVLPADEMDANGSQFARFKFDDRDQMTEGVLLSRGHGGNVQESYIDCTLDGKAVPVNKLGTSQTTDLGWTHIAPQSFGSNTNQSLWDVDNNGNEFHSALTDQHDAPGKLLYEVGNTNDRDKEARSGGNVHLYGLGDGSQLTWREGWNPLVLYITDPDGEPLKNQYTPEVTLKFLVKKDFDLDGVVEWNRYTWDTQGSQGGDLNLRELGNGYYGLDVYLPTGLSDGVELMQDHPEDPDQAIVNATTLKVELPSSAQSTANRDISPQGQATAYWRIQDLGMADSNTDTLIHPGSDDTNNPAAKSIEVNPPTTDLDENQRTFVQTAVRFMAGDPGNWMTGPGIHAMDVFVYEDRMESEDDNFTIESSSNHPDQFKLNFRDHRIEPHSNARPTFTWWPFDRGFAAGGNTKVLKASEDRDGHYTEAIHIPDLGRQAPWFLELDIEADGLKLYDMLDVAVPVDPARDPASHGMPMPLCISKAGAPSGVNDVFEPAELGSQQTILDLRAIPGLTLDRGPFSFTPFLEERHAKTNVLNASRHDVSGDLLIRGQGLAIIEEESTTLPTQGEVNVPIAIQARVTGTVDRVTATLENTENTFGPVTMKKGSDYKGEITATETGTYTLTIRAFDPQDGVDVLEGTIEIEPDQPPRISVTDPSLVKGIRAIQADGTVTAEIRDGILSTVDAQIGNHIKVFRKDTGGATADGSPLGTQGNVTITELLDEVEPGTHDMTVNITDDGAPFNGTVWVNATPSGQSDPTDHFNATLDDDGNATGNLDLTTPGTYTIEVLARNTSQTTDPQVDQSFSVEVIDTSAGATDVSSDATMDCEDRSCTVTYDPSGITANTSQIRVEIVAELPEGNDNRNETKILIDHDAPTASITVGTPKVSGTPVTVAPRTTLDISATDDTKIDSLRVAAFQGGSQLTAVTVDGASGEVSLSELGLSEDGSARIEVAASDAANRSATETLDIQVDTSGPTLSGITATVDAGDVTVQATAQDNAGIDEIVLWHKAPGANDFTTQVMKASGSTYTGTVENVGQTGKFQYYIRATDQLSNEGRSGSSSSPRTLDIGEADAGTNQAPEVVITSPQANDRAKGTITVAYTVSDPDTGDTATIQSVSASPTTGQTVPLTDQDGQATLDTTQLAEGPATITVTATDGTDTGSSSVTIRVDNVPDAGPCTPDQPLETGANVEVCFQLDTDGDVQQVTVELIRNGESLASQTLDPRADGNYRASFDIEEEGSYALKLTKTNADGSTEESTSEPFTVQSALDAISKPTGLLIATIIIAVLVVGVAGYGAFGRWNQ